MPTPGNLILVLSRMLTEFTTQNDHRLLHADMTGTCAFEAVKAPRLSIQDYFIRIDKYFNASEECFVISLILIDRLIHRYPSVFLSSHNVHRLLITSVVIAVKTRDDVYFSNRYYSDVAGITLKELNFLEQEFLQLLDFDLYVSFDEYLRYIQEIDERYGPTIGKSSEYLAIANERFADEEMDEDEYDGDDVRMLEATPSDNMLTNDGGAMA